MNWNIAAAVYFVVAGGLCITGALVSAFADPPWLLGIPAFSVVAAGHFAAAWYLLATGGDNEWTHDFSTSSSVKESPKNSTTSSPKP